MRRLFSLFVLILVSSLSAHAEADLARTYKGAKKRLGHGWAYSWVKLDSSKKPIEIGLTLTKGALSGLPPTLPKSMTFSLPRKVAPYNHIGLDWNPLGHEPDHVYDKPHFDVHFYWISKATRRKISCEGSDLARCQKRPASEYVPSDYVITPGGVPGMGAHWIDPYSDEFNGGTFTKTFIYGSYDGRMTFMEPMVTLEYLLTKPDFMSYVKDAMKVDRSGYYPTHYRIWYDAHKQTTSIALVDLRHRQAE